MQPALKQGQIWKECDPRMDRWVRIEAVGIGSRSIHVRAVHLKDGVWVETSNSRLGYASPHRFNGKRGGYAIWHENP